MGMGVNEMGSMTDNICGSALGTVHLDYLCTITSFIPHSPYRARAPFFRHRWHGNGKGEGEGGGH